MEKQIKKLIKKMPVGQQLIILLIVFGLGFLIQQNRVIDSTSVELIACVDGDTAQLSIAGKKERVRFIAVDAPELSTNDFYAKEAADYTCKALKNANQIKVEYDPKAHERDKFDRIIAWIYVDDVLLQSSLVEGGYAKVRYIYDDYLYVNNLNRLQAVAKKNFVGVWSN